MTSPTLRRRSGTLDSLRGLTLVSMMAYHACWDLVYLYGMPWDWYRSFWAYAWQQSICCTFILLSGYCWQMGRHPLRRGLMSFCGGAAVSLVTLVVMPEEPVRFGVLTFLGAAALLTVPLRSLLDRTPPRLGLAVSFLLFLLVRDVNSGFLGFAGVPVLHLPQSWYANTCRIHHSHRLMGGAAPASKLVRKHPHHRPGLPLSRFCVLGLLFPAALAPAVLDRVPPVPPAAGDARPAGHPPAGAYGHGPPFPCHLSAAPAGDLRPAGADLFLRRYLCLS